MRKLHFGCFNQIYEGWVNTDITPHLWITKVPSLPYVLFKLGKMTEDRYKEHKQGIFKYIKRLDITKPFPYKDEEYDCAYSSHVLEHLYYNQAVFCMSEIYRILKKGGIVRIAVPDLDKYVKEFDPSQPDKFCDAIFESKQSTEKNQHHWMYNENSLRKLLLDAGFSDAYRCGFRKGRCPEVEIIDNRPESLFMEAIK